MLIMLQVGGPAVTGQVSHSCVALGSRLFSLEGGRGQPCSDFCSEVSQLPCILDLLDSLQLSMRLVLRYPLSGDDGVKD